VDLVQFLGQRHSLGGILGPGDLRKEEEKRTQLVFLWGRKDRRKRRRKREEKVS